MAFYRMAIRGTGQIFPLCRGEQGTGVPEQHRGLINELRWSSHAPKGGNPSLEMRYGESAV